MWDLKIFLAGDFIITTTNTTTHTTEEYDWGLGWDYGGSTTAEENGEIAGETTTEESFLTQDRDSTSTEAGTESETEISASSPMNDAHNTGGIPKANHFECLIIKFLTFFLCQIFSKFINSES